MTRTLPWRRMILHLSHIFLTEGRTFIIQFPFGYAFTLSTRPAADGSLHEALFAFVRLLIAIGDASAIEIVDRKLDLNLISRKNLDVVHTHLP